MTTAEVKPHILNLTRHPATVGQIQAGVFDLNDEQTREVISLLVFHDLPKQGELASRATKLAGIVFRHDEPITGVMIDRESPFLTDYLVPAMWSIFKMCRAYRPEHQPIPMYAFTTYKHIGFVIAGSEHSGRPMDI
jgi:hypothetical protein